MVKETQKRVFWDKLNTTTPSLDFYDSNPSLLLLPGFRFRS